MYSWYLPTSRRNELNALALAPFLFAPVTILLNNPSQHLSIVTAGMHA